MFPDKMIIAAGRCNVNRFLTNGIVGVQSTGMSVAPDLLDLLTCPRCRGPLRLTPAGDGLVCSRCCVAYPVTDDIPVMIIEEAVPWTPAPADGPGRA
jgi:hypothetical protein